jgi:hypothetical protein
VCYNDEQTALLTTKYDNSSREVKSSGDCLFIGHHLVHYTADMLYTRGDVNKSLLVFVFYDTSRISIRLETLFFLLLFSLIHFWAAPTDT